jgi:catechol 2,3-dioxygenase-like lactoylglutathione lyase family enzyme
VTRAETAVVECPVAFASDAAICSNVPMPVIRSVSPRLPVHDLRRTIAFYRDLLDFEVVGVWPEKLPTFVILERNGVRLQFFTPEPPIRENASLAEVVIQFDVDDVKSLHALLSPHVRIEWGPEVYWYGCREFSFRDPNGYMVVLSEPTDDPPTCLDE